MREGGGNCLKYLKRGTQRFNKGVGGGGVGVKLGHGVGALKRGSLGPPYKL